jgi:hypothetical protein
MPIRVLWVYKTKGNTMNKYELLKTDTITAHTGATLYRIKALKAFGNVKAEELGGYVESEVNLSQDGDAWVYGSAQVFGDARVYGDVKVSKTPIVISGVKHTITITESHIFIGCEGHTIAHWKKNIVTIGKANGYSNGEIKNTIVLLKAVLKIK